MKIEHKYFLQHGLVQAEVVRTLAQTKPVQTLHARAALGHHPLPRAPRDPLRHPTSLSVPRCNHLSYLTSTRLHCTRHRSSLPTKCRQDCSSTCILSCSSTRCRPRPRRPPPPRRRRSARRTGSRRTRCRAWGPRSSKWPRGRGAWARPRRGPGPARPPRAPPPPTPRPTRPRPRPPRPPPRPISRASSAWSTVSTSRRRTDSSVYRVYLYQLPRRGVILYRSYFVFLSSSIRVDRNVCK